MGRKERRWRMEGGREVCRYWSSQKTLVGSPLLGTEPTADTVIWGWSRSREPKSHQPAFSAAANAWNPQLNRESSFYCQEHVPVSSKSINSLITLSGARCQAAVRER